MKTYYKTIPEWDNPYDYKEIEIDTNLNNQNNLEQKIERYFIKK